MIIYTAQMSKHKKAKILGFTFIDTTVKTGIQAFAPTWDMVLKFKKGELDWDTYTQLYLDMMRSSWKENPIDWKNLMQHECIVLGCYCTDISKEQCHRFLLRDMIKAIGKRYQIEVIDRGELT
jgi:uncharacterized protein YeaO (DUF488 family)